GFAERGRRTHPRAIERRRDEDAGRSATQTRERLDERLGDRARTGDPHLSEVLHQLAELFRAAVRLEDLGARAAGDESDIAMLIQRFAHDRCRDRDRALFGRVLTLAAMPVTLEVEVDPEVGGLVELELLHVEGAMPDRRRPVDAVHRVARAVLADAHDHRRRLERSPTGEDAALEDRTGKAPVREWRDAGIDEEQRLGRDARFAREQAERIARAKCDRAELVAAATDRLREHLPLAGLPATADREHATRQP